MYDLIPRDQPRTDTWKLAEGETGPVSDCLSWHRFLPHGSSLFLQTVSYFADGPGPRSVFCFLGCLLGKAHNRKAASVCWINSADAWAQWAGRVEMQTQILCQPVPVTREEAEGDFLHQPRRLYSVYFQRDRLSALFYWSLSYLCSSSMSPKDKQDFIAQIPDFLALCQEAGVCRLHRLLHPQGMRASVLLPCLHLLSLWSSLPSWVRLYQLSLHPISVNHYLEFCDEMLPLTL